MTENGILTRQYTLTFKAHSTAVLRFVYVAQWRNLPLGSSPKERGEPDDQYINLRTTLGNRQHPADR